MRPTHESERSANVLDDLRRGGDGGRATMHRASYTTTLRSAIETVAAKCHVLPLRAIIAVGVAVLVVTGIGAVVAVRSEIGTSVAVEPVVTVPAAGPTTTTGPGAGGAGVVVHASGAVRSPGVYRLPVGSRIVDLLERAGGPAVDLDLDRVNLAAPLADGQRVWLPRVGEVAPALAGDGGGGGAGPNLVDVNHASADQLDALPGIGPTLAAAIIADRTRQGPFRSVDDLLRVKGLSRSKVDALRELVVIG